MVFRGSGGGGRGGGGEERRSRIIEVVFIVVVDVVVVVDARHFLGHSLDALTRVEDVFFRVFLGRRLEDGREGVER